MLEWKTNGSRKTQKINSFKYSVTKLFSEMTFVEQCKPCRTYSRVYHQSLIFEHFFLIFLTSLNIKNTLSSLEDLHFLSDLSLVIKICRNLPSNEF